MIHLPSGFTIDWLDTSILWIYNKVMRAACWYRFSVYYYWFGGIYSDFSLYDSCEVNITTVFDVRLKSFLVVHIFFGFDSQR